MQAGKEQAQKLIKEIDDEKITKQIKKKVEREAAMKVILDN